MAQPGRGKGGSAGGVRLQRRRGDGAHRPAGFRRAGGRFGRRAGQKNGPSTSSGRQGQTAAGGQIHRPGAAPGAQQDGPDGRTSQRLFADSQQAGKITRADQQQVAGAQAHFVQARGIGTACFLRRHLVHAPHDRPSTRRFDRHPQAEGVHRHRVCGRGGVEIMQGLPRKSRFRRAIISDFERC